MLYVTDDKIKEFNNCNIKIYKVELEKDQLRAGFVLTILAWAIPKVQWFEEGNNNWFITSGDDMNKPIGYRLSIPYEIWFNAQQRGLNDLFEFIERSLPPMFEEHIYKILDEVAEIVYNNNLIRY